MPLALLSFSLALAAATVLCMVFVDRPVAVYFDAHPGLRPVFQACASPSLLALPGAALFLAYALARRLRGAGSVSRLWLVTSVAVLAGTAAKDELKWMFGRPWPETWLRYGIYRFHPFADSVLYGGFPSGHTAYISAPMGVLWVLLPRLRLLWAVLVLLVMVGLVGADYHFVSDVLAGLLTGIVCAWGSLVLMRPADA